MDNRTYYDEFAAGYENERHHGYHQMLDQLEIDFVRRYGKGRRVLEAGCGTGLLLKEVAKFAEEAAGFDLSPGMLEKARERGLNVVLGNVTEIPFPDESFDVVYSVKVLAHVEAIQTALAEIARVTKPGGVMLLEFYNKHSLRGIIKRLKPATPISENTNDEAVFTRYDTLDDVRGYLPSGTTLEAVRGIRVITPHAALHKVRGVGRALREVEGLLADAPFSRNFGGFLLCVVRKA